MLGRGNPEDEKDHLCPSIWAPTPTEAARTGQTSERPHMQDMPLLGPETRAQAETRYEVFLGPWVVGGTNDRPDQGG